MKNILHLKKEQQQLMPLFDGAFIENKPIPFPNRGKSNGYSNLFYWAHLEAFKSSEFPLHPHEGFEIMTFVLEGMGEHYDTATKIWTPLKAGDVQVIQAGSGVQHAERIRKGTKLFQIWFDPDFSKSMRKEAAYKEYPADSFKSKKENGIERLIYIGEGGVIVSETPDLSIEKLTFDKGEYIQELDENYTYSLYLIRGEIDIGEIKLSKDDYLRFDSSSSLNLTVKNSAELFVVKNPTNIDYLLF